MSPRILWPDERIALLRTHWDDGHSASQIAIMLGNISRCAVLGKAHRLGLTPRVSGSITMTERARRAMERNNRERGTRIEYFRERRAKLRGQNYTPRPPKLSEMIEDVSTPDPALSVTLLDIAHGQCRWIDGEPNGFETIMCGAVTLEDESFCPFHYLRTRTGNVYRYTGPKNHKKANQVIWVGCA